MSDQWEVGDLAECIAGPRDGQWYLDGCIGPINRNGPQSGEINRVTSIKTEDGVTGLGFGERYPERDGYFHSVCFRKLKPPKTEECTQLLEFLKQPQRAPVRETEDA